MQADEMSYETAKGVLEKRKLLPAGTAPNTAAAAVALCLLSGKAGVKTH
ncbi:hypothetical protein EWM64_g5239 [Hericium alpestre]|uniref:Uncharacterized protein n=1 Tax=Hericium alpestre TaxID=135208 RepID=A0A4Y9ZXM3_9AGAM|nr:hypothetical protein EWM64_g5239 [Hericium alpestre]